MGAVLESVDNIYPFLSGIENIRYFLSLIWKIIQEGKTKSSSMGPTLSVATSYSQTGRSLFTRYATKISHYLCVS